MSNEHDISSDLIDRLMRKAEDDPAFVGFAMALWRQRTQESLEHVLGCNSQDLWRLALLRRPASTEQFSRNVSRISKSLSCSEYGLAKVLRFADAATKLSDADDRAVLRAARPGPENTEDD
jgi:hypothetical protein